MLPTGRRPRLRGSGSAGLQFNLPFSKQTGDWYWHWNGGITWLPRAESVFPNLDAERQPCRVWSSPFFAGSGIYRVRPMFNLMLESVLRFRRADRGRYRPRDAFILSPGARGGWNIGDQQLIVGAADPITWVDGNRTQASRFISRTSCRSRNRLRARVRHAATAESRWNTMAREVQGFLIQDFHRTMCSCHRDRAVGAV